MLKLDKNKGIKLELLKDLKRSLLSTANNDEKKTLKNNYLQELKALKENDNKEYHKLINAKQVQNGRNYLAVKKLTKEYRNERKAIISEYKTKLANETDLINKAIIKNEYHEKLTNLRLNYRSNKNHIIPNTFKQLVILTKLNLSDSNSKSQSMRHLSIKYIILFVFALILFTYGFYFGFSLFRGLSGLDISSTKPFIKAFIGFIILTSIITSGLLLAKKLFDDKRETIIETFPVKKNLIYYSKLLASYLIELKKSFLVYLSLFIGYGLTFPETVLSKIYIFKAVIVVILLPLFTIAIGQLIAYILRLIYKVIGKNIISYLLIGIALLLLAVSFTDWFMSQFANANHEITKNSILLSLHSLFNYKLNNYIKYAYFTKALYNFVFFTGDIFYTINFLVLLILCGYLLVVSPYLYMLISKVKLTNSSKPMIKVKKLNKLPLYFASLIKELKETTRDLKQVISIMVYVALMPLIFYFLNSFFKLVILTSLGRNIVFLGELGMGLLLLTSGNFLAATIISREEQNMYMLKTNPQNIFSVISSKLTIPLVINIGVIITNFILNDITGVFLMKDNLALHLIFLLGILIHTIWVAEQDIESPDEETYKDSDNIQDNKNIYKAIFIGIIITTLITVLAYLFKQINEVMIFSVLMPLLLIFLGLRITFLVIKTKVFLRWLL